MVISVQKGFWQDKVLADSQCKLAQLYYQNPRIANSEKRAILEYWQEYENLGQILGDRLPDFMSWWESCTSPETITRSLRALKQDGIIKLSPRERQKRQERQEQWRNYFRNHNNGNGGHGAW
jgi:hypothetical protein